ncbi:MAG: nitrile hydratase subunit alpha [Proteobacteria bacterium]|nr:nitrile hydratase subunit alpha [Pseudomonadota bacterium]
MSQEHGHGDHGHGHPHPHGPFQPDDPAPADHELLEMAVRELLVEKGVIAADEVSRTIEEWEQKTPVDGARIVARAWTDPAFKARLLADAAKTVEELGLSHPGPRLVALENTETVHHLVVCTLCSCYPRPILGFPPAWYKSREYRSRTVREPRAVLREFGTELDPRVEVRVVDSTADCRYLVIPRRPEGTEKMSEAELAALVTRDSMIGVAEARRPG